MEFKKFIENFIPTNAVKNICVISAQNPKGVKFNDKKNKQLNVNLKLDLSRIGHDTKKIQGTFYGVPEEAFIVTNISKKNAINLGIKYKQQAIIWGSVDDDKFIFQYIEQDKVKQKIKINYRKQDVKNSNSLFDSIVNGKFSIPCFKSN